MLVLSKVIGQWDMYMCPFMHLWEAIHLEELYPKCMSLQYLHRGLASWNPHKKSTLQNFSLLVKINLFHPQT